MPAVKRRQDCTPSSLLDTVDFTGHTPGMEATGDDNDTTVEIDPTGFVGSNIRSAREAAGLSQRKLGRLLEPYLGEWVPQTVSLAEQGKRRVDTTELLAIAAVLGHPPSWFLAPSDPRVAFRFPSGGTVPYRTYLRPVAEDSEQLVVALSILVDRIGGAVEDGRRLIGALEQAGETAQVLRDVVDPPEERAARLTKALEEHDPLLASPEAREARRKMRARAANENADR
jgi:transcriptional regulator with XRE-family HTH domain